jgi:hypothetical protein
VILISFTNVSRWVAFHPWHYFTFKLATRTLLLYQSCLLFFIKVLTKPWRSFWHHLFYILNKPWRPFCVLGNALPILICWLLSNPTLVCQPFYYIQAHVFHMHHPLGHRHFLATSYVMHCIVLFFVCYVILKGGQIVFRTKFCNSS